MGNYTDQLIKDMSFLSIEDDNYYDELIKASKSFRPFSEALDDFLQKNGYGGNILNVKDKVSFIKKRFQDRDVFPLPRNIKNWFTDNQRIVNRGIAFQMCFAFSLDIKQSNEFLQRICLSRGFDCHSIEEAVYYFAICHALSYREAMKIIEEISNEKSSEINEKPIFTRTIISEIDGMKTKEELVLYLKKHLPQFKANNVTAYQFISEMWSIIEKELIPKELSFIYPKLQNKKRSTWNIFLQILGFLDFDDDNSPLFVLDTNRSLKPILDNNSLLHPLASDSFPDRQGFEAILRGEHKSNEVVRKIIILLAFYKYWMTLSLKESSLSYKASPLDQARCLDMINRYLLDSSYPSLYIGNPFDWIFLFAIKDDYPLDTFRFFMRELYINKQAENQL